MKKVKRDSPFSLFPVPVFFFIFVLFVSCATAPKVSSPLDEEGSELSLMPAGGKVYLWADTVKARPLLDLLSFEGKNGKDAAKVLDSTKTAAAVIFPAVPESGVSESSVSESGAGGGQGGRFFLAALGDYPGQAPVFLLLSQTHGKSKSLPQGTATGFPRRII